MLRTLLAACAALALSACLEQLPQREKDQWPIARAELEAAAAKRAAPPADAGEAAYRKTCIACHGADGHGNGGKTAADFASPTGALKKQDAVLLASIANGATGPIGVMPPHKALLSEAEITAVLAYVRRTFGAGITPEAVPAPDAAVPDAP